MKLTMKTRKWMDAQIVVGDSLSCTSVSMCWYSRWTCCELEAGAKWCIKLPWFCFSRNSIHKKIQHLVLLLKYMLFLLLCHMCPSTGQQQSSPHQRHAHFGRCWRRRRRSVWSEWDKQVSRGAVVPRCPPPPLPLQPGGSPSNLTRVANRRDPLGEYNFYCMNTGERFLPLSTCLLYCFSPLGGTVDVPSWSCCFMTHCLNKYKMEDNTLIEASFRSTFPHYNILSNPELRNLSSIHPINKIQYKLSDATWSDAGF